jgi:hypothetical protein
MTPLDTSPAANDIQLNILRRMSGPERLRIAIDLSEFARKLAFVGIEHDQPGLTKPQLIREFLRRVLAKGDCPPVLR